MVHFNINKTPADQTFTEVEVNSGVPDNKILNIWSIDIDWGWVAASLNLTAMEVNAIQITTEEQAAIISYDDNDLLYKKAYILDEATDIGNNVFKVTERIEFKQPLPVAQDKFFIGIFVSGTSPVKIRINGSYKTVSNTIKNRLLSKRF